MGTGSTVPTDHRRDNGVLNGVPDTRRSHPSAVGRLRTQLTLRRSAPTCSRYCPVLNFCHICVIARALFRRAFQLRNCANSRRCAEGGI